MPRQRSAASSGWARSRTGFGPARLWRRPRPVRPDRPRHRLAPDIERAPARHVDDGRLARRLASDLGLAARFGEAHAQAVGLGGIGTLTIEIQLALDALADRLGREAALLAARARCDRVVGDDRPAA